MKEKDFYEEIANWDFSKIQCEIIKKTDWDFYQEISKYVDKNSICLDLGTGGGEKVLNEYPEVGMLIATDFSKNMIETANLNLKKSGRKNVRFTQMDNLKITFPDDIFDLISARHTIINASELYRVLRKDGIVVIQGVDKEDCFELKDTFKRGQAYNDKKAISQIDYENLVNTGFKIIKKVRIEEDEYYKTKEDLLALLLKTPILDDFSEVDGRHEKLSIDSNLLNNYINQNKSSKGILLKRVLYGIIAKK